MRGAARRRRGTRPHPHQRRCVGGRGGPHQAGRAAARLAGPVADRDEAGQAFRLRPGRQRPFHRPAGQSGLQLRHLPAAGAALPAQAAGRDPDPCPGRCRCPRTSPGRARTSAASSCACAATPRAALELFPNQSSGVLTSTVWGDGFVDNPAGQAIARGDTVRFLPLRNCSHESSPAILRVDARGHWARRRGAADTRPPTWPALRDELIARGGRLLTRPGARQGGAHGAGPGDGRRATAAARRREVAFFPPVTGG